MRGPAVPRTLRFSWLWESAPPSRLTPNHLPRRRPVDGQGRGILEERGDSEVLHAPALVQAEDDLAQAYNSLAIEKDNRRLYAESLRFHWRARALMERRVVARPG